MISFFRRNFIDSDDNEILDEDSESIEDTDHDNNISTNDEDTSGTEIKENITSDLLNDESSETIITEDTSDIHIRSDVEEKVIEPLRNIKKRKNRSTKKNQKIINPPEEKNEMPDEGEGN